MNLRTPLKKVRHLGSANEGTRHFWQQRVTGIANLILVPFLVWMLTRYAGTDYATVKAALGQPWVALPLLLLIASATFHMRLGMQVIIEDYVHGEGLKIAALLANTFFAIFVAATAAYAILKLSFGG
jgi:succinate dehydrogenase / fumarate reductase membrane anchor subunit